jgi:hypothetical protein
VWHDGRLGPLLIGSLTGRIAPVRSVGDEALWARWRVVSHSGVTFHTGAASVGSAGRGCSSRPTFVPTTLRVQAILPPPAHEPRAGPLHGRMEL